MISIIIPTLNEENYLRRTLENLRQIKNTRYEIIISDGRSTDGTLRIAHDYTDKIAVYAGQERQTISNGRNLGAKEAAGNFLVFMDSDVIIPEPDDFFRKLLAEFSQNENLVAATVKVWVLSEMEHFGDKILFGLLNFINRVNNNFFHKGSASGEFQMMRKGVFEKSGGFNEKLVAGEDFEFFSRLSKIGQTRMITDLCIYHSGRRVHKVGWMKTMGLWVANYLSTVFFKKAASKEWKVIR